MTLPNLSLLDRIAIWLLAKSPRVSLLVVKDKFWPDVFFAADQTDPVARAIYENSLKEDPPSMVFERIFHQPAHGEDK
jgi:hypothetical protein